VLQEAIDDASPVEPRHDGEVPGDGGGLEPADLLHPPDVQLQVRPPGSQWIQAALCAPGEVAAQVGFGVLAGGALEPGQVGSHGEPQPVSYRHKAIGGDWDQFGEVRHDLTLRPLPAATKLAKPAPGAA